MKEQRGHKRKSHEHRVDLAGEHAWGDACQLILLIVFLVGMIGDLVFLQISQPIQEKIPSYLPIIVAVPVLLIAGYLAKSGLKTVFGKERTELMVIKSGMFALVRHPIYLGSILLYLGFIILSLSVIAFGIWIVIIVFYYYISKYEENILINRLGEEYRQYMNDVPMFIPKLKIK